MTTPDLNDLFTDLFPDIYRVAYLTCPTQVEQIFSEAIYQFVEWHAVNPAKYLALISTRPRAIATFRQLTRKAFSKILHDETRAESLDALESETGISEIEWETITRGSAIAQQRGKRSSGSHIATDEETEVLCANLAKASWGELDRVDIADVVRESAVLRMWLSGFSEKEIRKPATVKSAVQSLQNQI